MRYDALTEEFEELFASLLSTHVESVQQGIALRRVLVVPAHFFIFEHADVVLVNEVLDKNNPDTSYI